jgi:hypothetical protein
LDLELFTKPSDGGLLTEPSTLSLLGIEERVSRTIIAMVAAALVAAAGCSDKRPEAPGPEPPRLGERHLTLFGPGEELPLQALRRLSPPPETPLAEALAEIGRHLAAEVFASAADGEATGIAFAVRTVETLAAGEGTLRVAVVDLLDPRAMALPHFLQGSSGAAATFHVLLANFTQPQLAPPLLDGLVLLHNGRPFEELDHINLTGILIPRLVRPAARRAVQALNPAGGHAL